LLVLPFCLLCAERFSGLWLKFYLHILANIKEKQEVSEEIDAAVFGDLAHLSMEFCNQGILRSGKIEPTGKGGFRGIEQELDHFSNRTSHRTF